MCSEEETACDSHYIKHTKWDEFGRYIIHLPFSENKLKIGESRQTAFHRFHSLERKFDEIDHFKLSIVNGFKVI